MSLTPCFQPHCSLWPVAPEMGARFMCTHTHTHTHTPSEACVGARERTGGLCNEAGSVQTKQVFLQQMGKTFLQQCSSVHGGIVMLKHVHALCRW